LQNGEKTREERRREGGGEEEEEENNNKRNGMHIPPAPGCPVTPKTIS